MIIETADMRDGSAELRNDFYPGDDYCVLLLAC